MKIDSKEIKRAYNLSDLWLIPRKISHINSRKDIDTSISFCEAKLSLPIIGSPMPDVCDFQMLKHLGNNGCYGFLHRFQSIDCQIKGCYNSGLFSYEYGVAIGINDKEWERFLKLYDYGVRSFCLDTANAGNIRVIKLIEKLLDKDDKLYITVGNVASKEVFSFLCQYPITTVRCMIGSGSACSTRFETSVYHPSASCLIEIVEYKRENKAKYSPLIIADGGINTPHDFCIALAIGADICMMGKVLASSKESPAKTLKIDDKLKKIYRGAASFSNQLDHTGLNPDFVEGFETMIDYGGNLSDILKRFSGGLRSAMSYLNAKNLEEFRNNAWFCHT